MPDALFDHPRLARVYDPLDPDRSDLDAYVDLVAELDARVVLDVGCGTGTFASLLAQKGIQVIGIDPLLRPWTSHAPSPGLIVCGGSSATGAASRSCRSIWRS